MKFSNLIILYMLQVVKLRSLAIRILHSKQSLAILMRSLLIRIAHKSTYNSTILKLRQLILDIVD
jgi:hypothetical protein